MKAVICHPKVQVPKKQKFYQQHPQVLRLKPKYVLTVRLKSDREVISNMRRPVQEKLQKNQPEKHRQIKAVQPRFLMREKGITVNVHSAVN